MNKEKIKSILKNLMLSLIVIVPSLAFATTEYEKGDIKNSSNSFGKFEEAGDVYFEKTVTKTNEKGIYEIALDIKGKDVTKEVVGNTNDIYIAVVLDISYSMTYADNKYENAVAGAKYFAKKVLEKNENANLALVTFGQKTYRVRDFDNEDFDSSITVSASVKEGKTLVTIGNISCDDEVEISLEAVGASIPSDAKAIMLYNEDIHAHNTFENPKTVVPTDMDLDISKPFTIPKAGILAIRF